MQGSRVVVWVAVCGAQLLLKLQHLVHQMAEESIIIQQPRGILGQFLIHQCKKPSAQLHLMNTGETPHVSDPCRITYWSLKHDAFDFSYLRINFCTSTVKNGLNFLLHEIGIVPHPHEDLSQVPLRL